MPPPARSAKAFTMAYPGFQRGGCLSSGPIRKASGGGGGGVLSVSGPVRKAGGGGGGAVGFWPGTKIGGGGGGVLSVSGPVRKAGGGGGGGGGGLAQYKRVSRMCWRSVLKSLRARNFWQPRPFLRRRGVPEPPEPPPPPLNTPLFQCYKYRSCCYINEY